MVILERISIQIGKSSSEFDVNLMSFLSKFGSSDGQKVEFYASNPNYLPKIMFEITDLEVPTVKFVTEKESTTLGIRNSTGVSKSSPHTYTTIELTQFLERIKSLNITRLDHIGFDLPWFNGVHPEISKLRNVLKNQCAYFLWPENEPWDFIIPATQKEIKNPSMMDMNTIRQPKFEIVSIDKVSKPIIQVDFGIKESYELLKDKFPEGLFSDELENVWVYIKNDLGIDICFVINAQADSDWSEFFSNSRLT